MDRAFDLSSGRPCDADAVRQRLTARFAAIDQIAEQADLATKARERVNKARRVLGAMVATIARVWLVIRTRVDSLRLPPPLKRVLIEQLIAGLCLVRVAAKARSPVEHAAITPMADRLLAQARAPDGPWRPCRPSKGKRSSARRPEVPTCSSDRVRAWRDATARFRFAIIACISSARAAWKC